MPGRSAPSQKSLHRQGKKKVNPFRYGLMDALNLAIKNRKALQYGGKLALSHWNRDPNGNQKKVFKRVTQRGSHPISNTQHIKKLRSDVKKMKPKMAQFTDFSTVNGQLVCNINQCDYVALGVCDSGMIENTLGRLPFTEVSAGVVQATTTVDFKTVTKHTKWAYDYGGTLVVRNNYKYPCDIRWYEVVPRTDSSLTAKQALDLVDNNGVVGSTSFQDIAITPNNLPGWSAYYKIIKSGLQRMNPGEELKMTTFGSGLYDQEYLDENTYSFPKKHTKQILLRIQGVVCHDTVDSAIVGYSDGGVDYSLVRHIKMRYTSSVPTKVVRWSADLGSVAIAQTVVDQEIEVNSLE